MTATTQFSIEQLTTSCGAIVHGVDVSQVQTPDQVAFIRQALLDHGVIFFRGQSFTTQQHWDFGKQFGIPLKEESSGTPENTAADVMAADLGPTRNSTAVWHADTTSLACPPWGATLRPMKLPGVGGDTCWSSAQAAYEALSAPWRTMLDGLTAVHHVDALMERMGEFGKYYVESFLSRHAPSQVHPVVLTHAETGRKGIFVNEAFTTRIVELEPTESQAVLQMLFRHMESPRFSMRWRWALGDMVFWDNRSVQHYAVPDYLSGRVMERIVYLGTRPGGERADTVAAKEMVAA